MLASLSSNAIMIKAKAMYGKRLTPQHYSELAHKKNIAEIAEYLKNETSYGEALASVQPGTVHRGQLENMLHKVRFDRYLRLLHFCSSAGDDYYRYLVREFEIQQILQMISLLNAGRPQDYITQYPAFLGHITRFHMMALAKARSFDDLLEVLKGSPYGSLIQGYRPAPGEKIDYISCESVLMKHYYQNIQRIIDESFTGSTKRQLHEIFDTAVELKNIAIVYRLKKYFPNVGADYIKSRLMPHWKRIPARVLDGLIGLGSAEEFMRGLAASAYGRFLNGSGQAVIEYGSDCINYQLCKRYLRFATGAPTAFTAYMVLSDLELANITNITEGIRYGVSPGELEKMLVM